MKEGKYCHELIRELQIDILEIKKDYTYSSGLSLNKIREMSYIYLNRINSLIGIYKHQNLSDFNIKMILEEFLIEGFFGVDVLELLIKYSAERRYFVLNQLYGANYLNN